MEGSLWDRFVTGAPRSSQRGATGLSPLARARRQSCNTAIRWLASVCLQTLRSASFARGTEQRTGHQPQDGREVAQACDGRGYEDRAEGAAVDSFERRGRGGGGGVSSSYAFAVGRLSVCLAALDPASYPVCAASVPAAARHFPSSGCRGRQAQAPGVQALPHPLADRRCLHRRKAGSSTSISPRCRQLKGSSISSWALIERPNSPSLNSLQRLTERRPGSFCSTCLRPCLTKSTPS